MGIVASAVFCVTNRKLRPVRSGAPAIALIQEWTFGGKMRPMSGPSSPSGFTIGDRVQTAAGLRGTIVNIVQGTALVSPFGGSHDTLINFKLSELTKSGPPGAPPAERGLSRG